MSDAENTINKTFDPGEIEQRWYPHWEEKQLFRPERPDAAPFTIVNPPPNVTGSLHVGHALDNTLQDIIIRYERMRGKDALWVVGTDHAGIATQMVVERQMEQRQDKRANYTREAFIEKVWEWKEESGGTITRQLRRLGCSMDWSREQFTMDPHFTQAVTKVFVDLYNEGLIYRDKRLVNWDPKLKTAISDLEVETRETNGHFWHFKYPLADGATTQGGKDHIIVATTRPETMLADMAVAVHPSDERYAALVAAGAKVKLPITGREIPIVADDHADPELGSGAVKITPGHDFNDFEVGKRAGFAPGEMLNMLDAEAKVVQTADGLLPDELIGIDRFDARKQVVAMLDDLGLLDQIEDRVIQTPYGDRGGVVIEPWLTDQWYVDAEKLAGPAIEAAKSGAIDIVPKTWEKTWYNWLENIQPWCISRQLWWGHQIPAWYDDQGNVFVAPEEAGAREQAGSNAQLTRDPDVLDTWFSSALWPFATLGWPDQDAPLLAKHYPGDLLISGFDILFFWDARMAMQGLHLMGDADASLEQRVPWKRLYLHGLVRAADGSKMAKTKGNVVDPLILIDKYGADALRFFMAAMESQGRDIKMDESRVEGYRNFATKLWNAARFAQSNGIGASDSIAAPEAGLAVNRWIIGKIAKTVAALDKGLADLRFDAAANVIYHFVFDDFCDWYLELIKPVLQGTDESGAAETRRVAGWALDQILVMLHPFMPFITEELWHNLAGENKRPYELILAKWPEPGADIDAEAQAEIEWLIDLIGEVRSAKVALGVAPGAKLTAHLPNADESIRARIEANSATLDRVGRIEAVKPEPAPEGASAQIVVGNDTFIFPLEGVIDIEAEKARLTKALQGVEKEAKSLEGRLANPKFLEKAKPEAVEKAKADHADKSAEKERLEAALARLG